MMEALSCLGEEADKCDEGGQEDSDEEEEEEEEVGVEGGKAEEGVGGATEKGLGGCRRRDMSVRAGAAKLESRYMGPLRGLLKDMAQYEVPHTPTQSPTSTPTRTRARVCMQPHAHAHAHTHRHSWKQPSTSITFCPGLRVTQVHGRCGYLDAY